MVSEKPVYRFTEYETQLGVRLSKESAELLRTNFARALTLRPVSDGVWDITASSYVGRIELADVAIHIFPKVPVETLWEWLIWAYDIRSLRFQLPVTSVGELTGNEEWLVKFFVKECYMICRKGLHTGYETRIETLGEVRGQLRIAPTVRRWNQQEPRFVCEYDEPTRWVPENRLLYAGLQDMAVTIYQDARVGRDIRSLLTMFAPHSQEERAMTSAFPPVPVSRKLAELAQQPLNRLNRHYNRAFTWLRMYWNATAFSLREGAIPCDSFLLDMNELFERYVARRMIEDLRPYGIEGKAQPHHWLGEAGQIRIVPDLILRGSGKEVVLDTKYKVRMERAENPDVFQMLAYMTARSASAGILLYAAGPERTDKIKHTDKTIYRWSLRLDTAPAAGEQERALQTIIQRIRELFY